MSTHETNISKEVHNIFVLMKMYATGMALKLNPKKICRRSHIFHNKNKVKEFFSLKDIKFKGASKKDIIHVNNQGQEGCKGEPKEEAQIKCRLLETIGKKFGGKLYIPLSRGLFEAVEGSKEKTDISRLRTSVTRREEHIDLLI